MQIVEGEGEKRKLERQRFDEVTFFALTFWANAIKGREK